MKAKMTFPHGFLACYVRSAEVSRPIVGEARCGCWLTIHFISTYHPGSFHGEPVIPRWFVLNSDPQSRSRLNTHYCSGTTIRSTMEAPHTSAKYNQG